MSNIYEKLQAIRVELAAKNIKKGGRNTYSNYDYYNLADFLPELQKLMQEHKMTSQCSFTADTATLTLIDIEKPDAHIEFTAPMSSATLKAAHPVQNLGAVITYERRYLYMTAFEIVEADLLDAVKGNPETMAQVPAAKSPTKEFIVNDYATPQEELLRFWQFIGWNPAQLTGYVNNWAERNRAPLNDTTYKAVLMENIKYIEEEAANGNPVYVNKKISHLPF
jgi:hypothetical protein